MKLTRKIIYVLIFILLLEISLRTAGFLYVQKKMSYPDESQFRILTLGESSTIGLWVDKEDSYPMQLKRLLNENGKNTTVIVPVHMGQNTGHISNRINRYISEYDPDIIVIMAGINNEWSLAESHISQFVGGLDKIRFGVVSFFDNFRTYRLIRYAFQIFSSNIDKDYVLGGPEYVRWPPKNWIYSFSLNHQEEFAKLWKYDMENMADAAKDEGIDVILMTYPIDPDYLDEKDYLTVSRKDNVYLVRNDLLFQDIIDGGQMSDYVFSKDNWHPNEKGYRLIAENLAEFILDNELLK